MTRNVGGVDRGIRAALGVGLVGYGFAAGSWWGLLGVGLLVNAGNSGDRVRDWRDSREMGRIMQQLKVVTLVLVAAVIGGCATGYGEKTFRFGYTDSQIDENTFMISFAGNAYTSDDLIQKYVLYRAAEVTAAAGYDYFVVVNARESGKTIPFAMPGSSSSYTTGSAYAYGNAAYGSATTNTSYVPGQAFNIHFPASTVWVKGFKGDKPVGDPSAFDSGEILKYLGPEISKTANNGGTDK